MWLLENLKLHMWLIYIFIVSLFLECRDCILSILYIYTFFFIFGIVFRGDTNYLFHEAVSKTMIIKITIDQGSNLTTYNE